MASLQVGERVERYEVEKLLGLGGMASVYRVRHIHLHTLHALKVLEVGGGRAEARLLTEGRIQAGMRHPNIVTVTDVLEVQGRPALLMEYVPPPTLHEWIGQGPLPLDEVIRLMRGVLAGVGHAHAHGLVHRDLKPSNVLLAQSPEGLVPRVSDFGIAKVLDAQARETASGSALGTPQYMAPEQFRDAGRVDSRADIYALGLLLAELLSAETPAYGGDLIDLYQRMALDRTPELQPGLPPSLITLVEGSVRFHPADRFPDCATMLRVLDGTQTFPPRSAPAVASAPRSTSAPPASNPPQRAESQGAPTLIRGGTLVPDPSLDLPHRDVPVPDPSLIEEPAPEPRSRWALAGVLFVPGVVALLGWWATTGAEPMPDAAGPADGPTVTTTAPPQVAGITEPSDAETVPTGSDAMPAAAPPVAPGKTPAPTSGMTVVTPPAKPTAGSAVSTPRGSGTIAAATTTTLPGPGETPPQVAATASMVTPAPPVAPAAQDTFGVVTFSGVQSMRLRRDTGSAYEPAGRHAPGRYMVFARFDDGEAQTGFIDVHAGETVHLTCDRATRSCRR